MNVKKKVIFWGCGKIAKEMYQKYKDEISFAYGISNNSKEVIFIPESGMEYEVKKPENKRKNADGLIVICSADYERIAEQLLLLGYTPFVDFLDYQLADILWSGKKIILLYGPCHLRGVTDCLKEAKAFLERYIPVYYPNYMFLNFYQQERFQYLIHHCSVFVYGIAVSPENYRKNLAILGALEPDVKRICLHIVYFGGYFPQKKRAFNNMNEFAIKSEGADYTPFSYGDSWLNECIAGGMELDDVFDHIENQDIYEKDFVLKYIEGEWQRLKYQEQESDFKIAEYIEKNYRQMRLFRNEAHMENQILYQYAVQLLQHLDIDSEINMPEIPLMNCSQHFIYPCVAKILGLQWDVWSEELDLYTYAGWKKVTVREYIRKYYETCYEIYQLKQKHFLP